MARRSDHTRPELHELILAEGHRLLAEVGFAQFSAREVAKRIGYSIGTVYNVFGNFDRLIVALNSRTYSLWAKSLREKLTDAGVDRIAALVENYFDFARRNRNLWLAIYEHRVPEDETIPDLYLAQRAELIGILESEIVRVLPEQAKGKAGILTRSLVATVHGHCFFALNGTFAILGVRDPEGMALSRVRESLSAAGAHQNPT